MVEEFLKEAEKYAELGLDLSTPISQIFQKRQQVLRKEWHTFAASIGSTHCGTQKGP